MYLRTNLQQFPLKLPINPYYDYVVTINDQNTMIEVYPSINPDLLLLQLGNDCDMFYQILLTQLHLLP